MPSSLQADLPADALARWCTLEERRVDRVGPEARVRAWVERLRARLVCSSGRLGRLLLEMGLCDLDTIAGCVRAQLDAGTAGESQLRTDVEADVDLLVERGPLELAEALCRRVASLDWLLEIAGHRESDLAKRLLDAGRESDCEAALARITWHGPLLDWLRHHPKALSAEARTRLLARAAHLVTGANLRPELQVEPLVELAERTGNRSWLDRASGILSTLSPEQIEAAGPQDRSGLVTDVACALAGVGAFDDAMASVSTLPPDARWNALVRLVPMAPRADVRAALIEELLAKRERFEGRWWELIEAAPEIVDRVLTTIEAIPDEEQRLEELWAILRYVDRERAREVCKWMLGVAERRDRGSESWTQTRTQTQTQTWEYVLDALTETGCEALLVEDRRRELVDLLLADPERALWSTIAAYVPDDRASAVLEVSRARLAVAKHYTERDKWIGVGLAVLARAPEAEAARWREVAAAQMPRTAIEDYAIERFAAWSPAQQRGIVLARLAQHQHEFLAEWMLEPWARAARARKAVGLAADPEARADAQRTLDALTATTAWPTLAQVGAVLDALEQCAGADAVTRVAEACLHGR